MKLIKLLFKFFDTGGKKKAKLKSPPASIALRRRRIKIPKHNIEQYARDVISRFSQNEFDCPSPPLANVINLTEELELLKHWEKTPQMRECCNKVRQELSDSLRELKIYMKSVETLNQ